MLLKVGKTTVWVNINQLLLGRAPSKNWIPRFLNLFALAGQTVASNTIPWLSITGYLAIAAVLLLASVKILDRLEY